LRNAYRKRLSYEREFHAIESLRGKFTFLPRLLLFIQWKESGRRLCALATEALDGWTSFADWIASKPDRQQVDEVLKSLASVLRGLHQARWAHFGLFQKHIFLRFGESGPEIKLIDFEKARKCLTRKQCLMEDLSRFLRHSGNLDPEQQTRFLKAYFQTSHLRSNHWTLIQRMRGVAIAKH